MQQLCGVYSPFTVEANYNGDMPDYNVPHTLCHELSHLKGFMREDEAILSDIWPVFHQKTKRFATVVT